MSGNQCVYYDVRFVSRLTRPRPELELELERGLVELTEMALSSQGTVTSRSSTATPTMHLLTSETGRSEK